VCIEEKIPMLLATQFLDDYFDRTILYDNKISRINHMTSAKYGRPCCKDKE